MQLLKNSLEFLRHGQAEVRSVFQHAHALVGEVEAHHGPAQCAAGAYDVQVYDVRHTDQQEDEHLAADAPETHSAGQLFVGNGAHEPGHVVEDDEDDQRDHQAVHAS